MGGIEGKGMERGGERGRLVGKKRLRKKRGLKNLVSADELLSESCPEVKNASTRKSGGRKKKTCADNQKSGERQG